MEILFITSEVAPFSKVGGLGDVCSALPKALRGLDHKVTVLSPLYGHLNPQERGFARRLIKLEANLGGKKYPLELYEAKTPSGVDLYFIGNAELFGNVPHIYGGGDAYEQDAIRFGALSQAAVQLAKTRDGGFDVLHAHDWQSSLAIILAKQEPALAKTACVLTLHNLSHQGNFPRSFVETLGLPASLYSPEGLEFYEKMSLLKGGIAFADAITTVSPTYSREILTPEGGHGMDGVLRSREANLHGILNGIDAAIWNPATDTHLAARFDPMNLSNKARAKADLQKALGLPIRADLPLVGSVGRFAFQKGYDLLAKAGPQLVRNDMQLVVLGEGDAEIQEAFAELTHRWPDRVQVRATYDEALAHRIFAGSDLFVVPSRFEPCGLTQMYAQRYGALPVVRNTGGLSDTVVDCDSKLETGTGFVFDEPSPQALLAAVQRGISAFSLGAPFANAQRRVMQLDRSWEKSARLYDSVYRNAKEKLG